MTVAMSAGRFAAMRMFQYKVELKRSHSSTSALRQEICDDLRIISMETHS